MNQETIIKRPFAFVGSILNVVMYGIYIISLLVEVRTLSIAIDDWTIWSKNSYSNHEADSIINQLRLLQTLIIVLIVLCIVALVFSSICISLSNKSVGKFNNKRGFFITSFVFNCVVCTLGIIGCVNSPTNTYIIDFPIILVLILDAVFIIIDTVKNRNVFIGKVSPTNMIQNYTYANAQTQSTQQEQNNNN